MASTLSDEGQTTVLSISSEEVIIESQPPLPLDEETLSDTTQQQSLATVAVVVDQGHQLQPTITDSESTPTDNNTLTTTNNCLRTGHSSEKGSEMEVALPTETTLPSSNEPPKWLQNANVSALLDETERYKDAPQEGATTHHSSTGRRKNTGGPSSKTNSSKRSKRKRKLKTSDQKKSKKRKTTNERRNIRQILTSDQLMASTVNAQKEEVERMKRLHQQRTIDVSSWFPELKEMRKIGSGFTPSSSPRLSTPVPEDDVIVVDSDLSSDSEDDVTSSSDGGSSSDGTLTDDERDDDDVDDDNGEGLRHLLTNTGDGDPIILSSDSEPDLSDDEDLSTGLHVNDDFNIANDTGDVLVNVNHPADDPDIFLARQISRAVKPHQIGGIRYLYDNLVESVARFDTSTGFGCILAHSMGLGKTLQMISFIDIFLRFTSARKVICIVPINTLQNWVTEFDMWLPASSSDPTVQKRSFDLYCLNETHKTPTARTKIIAEWHVNGGVLLMGYEMFRQLTHPKKKTKKSNAEMYMGTEKKVDENFEKLKHGIKIALLKPGADLVVCDEGHRIKNCQASVSQALKNIRTKRRIVLTGYPLQNNLIEYWCMVDFVRPNFLGTRQEFSNMFERPIQNGQCLDSTPQDVKLMKYRVHVLHKLLEGFVQRRGHSVLHSVLPEKKEYILLVRMSPIQKLLYEKFVTEFMDPHRVGIQSSNPIKAFAVFCKIWNHPDVLYNTLNDSNIDNDDLDIPVLQPAATSNKLSRNYALFPRNRSSFLQSQKESTASLVPPFPILPASSHVSDRFLIQQPPMGINFPEKTNNVISYDWARPLMENYSVGVEENGTKITLLFIIIEQCLSQGEKLLVFSQSLSTLTLIEKFLVKRTVPYSEDPCEKWSKNQNYYRLDGSTSSLDREKLISNFNSSTNRSVKMFLLSTRAGCLGINLVGANNVIIFDASWNPCHDVQAICRVYRYGQNNTCKIYRLVTDNTLEKKIYDRQISKQGMAGRVVDELQPEAVLMKKDTDLLACFDNDNPIEDFTSSAHKFADPIMHGVCLNYSHLITKEPFEHESLLADREDQRLTRAEKKEAQQNYEADKRAVTLGQPQNKFTSMFTGSRPMTENRPIANVRPMEVTPIPMQPMSSFLTSKNNVSVKTIVTTSEIIIPWTNTQSGVEARIPVGEMVTVIRTPQSMYIRTRSGKLFAVNNLPRDVLQRLTAQSENGADGDFMQQASRTCIATLLESKVDDDEVICLDPGWIAVHNSRTNGGSSSERDSPTTGADGQREPGMTAGIKGQNKLLLNLLETGQEESEGPAPPVELEDPGRGERPTCSDTYMDIHRAIAAETDIGAYERGLGGTGPTLPNYQLSSLFQTHNNIQNNDSNIGSVCRTGNSRFRIDNMPPVHRNGPPSNSTSSVVPSFPTTVDDIQTSEISQSSTSRSLVPTSHPGLYAGLNWTGANHPITIDLTNTSSSSSSSDIEFVDGT